MFTLIKREIEDNYVFFIVVIIFALFFSGLLIWHLYYDKTYDVPFIALPVLSAVICVLLFCAMGAAQMYSDRTKKVSALLATLAVSRGQIFAARVITGVLLVLIGFISTAETVMIAILTSKFIAPPFLHAPGELYFKILIPALLLEFAGYCIGLQAGWTSGKIRPTLGALGLACILFPLVVIKGFGWEIYPILAGLILACIIRAWYKYSTAAF